MKNITNPEFDIVGIFTKELFRNFGYRSIILSLLITRETGEDSCAHIMKRLVFITAWFLPLLST
jgi:hypothetical protein